MTLAADIQQAGEFMMETMSETAVLALQVMTEGLPAQYTKQARQVLKFYEEESTEEFWERMAITPDPENPGQSVAMGLIDQWAQYKAAVGKPDGMAGGSS